MKKILISLISLIILTACVSTRYSYYPVSSYGIKKVSISVGLANTEDENSHIDYIWVYDERSKISNHHKVRILSPTIKIVDKKNKEYILKNNPDDDGNIYMYKQGVVITDDFKAYIGKVQLDDGTIIDIPPLSFKKNVYVESYNPVTDTINAGGRGKEIFSGTVEDYKNQKK